MYRPLQWSKRGCGAFQKKLSVRSTFFARGQSGERKRAPQTSPGASCLKKIRCNQPAEAIGIARQSIS
jgi:hypothetical protein